MKNGQQESFTSKKEKFSLWKKITTLLMFPLWSAFNNELTCGYCWAQWECAAVCWVERFHGSHVAAGVALTACAGLAAGGEADVAHRDLKRYEKCGYQMSLLRNTGNRTNNVEFGMQLILKTAKALRKLSAYLNMSTLGVMPWKRYHNVQW